MDRLQNRPTVTQAHTAFREARYHVARNHYSSLGAEIGEHLFRTNIELCDRAERKRFLKHKSPRPHARDEHITYCVPIFDRLDDLKKTLRHNLNVLAQFHRVKLVINLFDRDDEAYRWATEAGRAHIESGLLSINRRPPLNAWHFCWAKNSFADFIEGGFYSSLDGDNYLTTDEVLRTKQALAEFGPCIIHHFSGNWGDGTCGRVTLPAKLYRQGRYNNDLFPRQFDEFSLILNALKIEPETPIISRNDVNIFKKSHYLRLLTKYDGWTCAPIGCDLGRAPAPENGKKEGYVQENPVVRHFGWINGYYSLYKVARTQKGREEFARRTRQALQHAQSSDDFAALARDVFHYRRSPGFEPHNARTTRIALVKQCTEATHAWLAQQRAEGITHFIIVEYGATPGQPPAVLGKDILILRPVLGNSDLFSAFWLESVKVLYNLTLPVQTPSILENRTNTHS